MLECTAGGESSHEKNEEEEAEKSCNLKGRMCHHLNGLIVAEASESADAGLHIFGQSKKEVSLAEVKVKERQLEIEERNHNDLIEERYHDRICQKVKEKTRSKLELEKVHLMMDLSKHMMMKRIKQLIEEQKKKNS